MNINDLKQTWKLFKLQHSLDVIDREEVMSLIDLDQESAITKVHKLYGNYALFLLLMLCCQGG